MRTRAKFYVAGLTLLPGKDAGVTVNLSAVSRGDRNADWAAATPCGTVTMTINNPAAAERWREFMDAARASGKSPEVFVDFAPSEDGWPGDGHPFSLADVPEGHYTAGKCAECGLGKDDQMWDTETRKPDPDRLVHPNG